MLILAAVLLAVPSTTGGAASAAICAVGRLALKDLPTIYRDRRSDVYYDDADPLLAACPRLRGDIPEGYPLPDAEARARANMHAPSPGSAHVRTASIYSIALPRISADGRSATVEMGYVCTGLCAGTFLATYRRTIWGWRRSGPIRMSSVS